jgi:D-amino-acid oxidase
MKIAIIGSGFFGLTLGLFLSKKNEVHIFEKEKKILNGASAANQFRFHLGYHYPRSQKTVSEINKSKNLFTKYYGKTIFQKTLNYYLIANDSVVDFNQYKKFLKKNKLYYKIINPIISNKKIDKKILTNEKILNYFKFKKIISKKIKNSKLKIKLSKQFKKSFLENYDKVIVAAYSNNNKILENLGIKKLDDFKFELVEKIVIKLPKKFFNKSFVVVDGKFVCVDPYLGTNYHLLSDVKLSKLETKIGKFPIFKNKNKKYLNKGIIKNIRISRFKAFIKRSSAYLPFLNDAKYIGSMFVVRTIKKNKERTDERTSSVTNHSKKIISVMSGKWNNCVYLAKNFKINH